MMFSRFIMVMFCAIFVALPQSAYADPLDISAIDARLERLMDEPGMVGLAVAIVEGGELVHVKGYGETLAGSGDAVTEETVFRWASLSKSVAASMIVKLVDEGRLSLEQPASNYSKSLRLPGGGEKKATVQNLLSHQLGIIRNAYDNRLEGGGDPTVIRGALASLPLQCEIGTCHGYQNVAFDTASEIVQTLSGQGYEKAVQQNLFSPLGIYSASMSKSGLQNSLRWARPHNRNGYNVYRTMRESYFRVPAAGGVNSNIKDLGLWLRAQMGNDESVISASMRSAMHKGYVNTPREARRSRQYFPRFSDAQYGLGWRIYDYAGRKVVGHRGAVNGYRALILFDPELNVGVAALWNSGSNQPVGLQMEVMDMAYGFTAQDWLYLGDGPDLAAVRARRLSKRIAAADAPTPRLSPERIDSSLPVSHGQPLFMLSNCFAY